MALSLDVAGKEWQKAKTYLLSAGYTAQNAFKDLKLYLAQQKKNPNIQVIPVDGVSTASDGGNNASVVAADSPCTLYGIYLKKVGATETIFKGSNNATTAGTDGTQDIAIAATVAGDVFEIYPDGRAMSAGFTYCENTARTTSTKNVVANAMSGFIVIGA